LIIPISFFFSNYEEIVAILANRLRHDKERTDPDWAKRRICGSFATNIRLLQLYG
jgi:hypothetical protein